MSSAARAAELYGAANAPSPLVELVEVHDGMIARLRDVQSAIDEGRIEDRCSFSNKVAKVIEVLQVSLDRERGGDVAANLDRIYTYVAMRLNAVNFTNDATICDELIARLEELRDGWRALMHVGIETQSAPPEAASLSA